MRTNTLNSLLRASRAENVVAGPAGHLSQVKLLEKNVLITAALGSLFPKNKLPGYGSDQGVDWVNFCALVRPNMAVEALYQAVLTVSSCVYSLTHPSPPPLPPPPPPPPQS